MYCFWHSSADPVQNHRWFHESLYLPSSYVSDYRVNVFEKIIKMTNKYSYKIHCDGISYENRKCQHDPREIRSFERKHSEKTHSCVLVSSPLK